MKLISECYPCVLNQTLSTSRLTGLNEKQEMELMIYSLKKLLSIEEGNITPQEIIRDLYQYVESNFVGKNGSIDPYMELKKKSNDIALNHYEEIKEMVDSSDNPLYTAVKAAAAGNIIDFGAKDHGSLDIEKEIGLIPSLEFDKLDFDRLQERLSSSSTLLYIGDNAGEIVFDRLLCETINRIYPEIDIVFAVRDKPIINDATEKDAIEAGIDTAARIISSGSIYPGTILEKTSDSFKELFSSSDILISKGQGNFETLFNEHNPNLFFILRTKCQRIANVTGSKVGALLLINQSG